MVVLVCLCILLVMFLCLLVISFCKVWLLNLKCRVFFMIGFRCWVVCSGLLLVVW